MADFHMLFLCATVIHAYVGLIQTGAVTATYSEDVEKVFQNLKNNESGMSICIDKAREKMNKFSDYEQDSMYAVGIIHLYTQNCTLLENKTFFGTLNSKMRNGQADGVWKLAGDLINEAIDLLPSRTHRKVYRGCTKFDNIPEEGEKCFRFNQITSTSKDLKNATNFAGHCGFLFEIKNVHGLFAVDYSEFPSEKEVILKSTHSFDVTKVIKGKSEIEMELGFKTNLSTWIFLDGGETPTCKGWKTVPILFYILSLVVFSIKFL